MKIKGWERISIGCPDPVQEQQPVIIYFRGKKSVSFNLNHGISFN